MAYTNNPSGQTYKTFPVEFTGQDYFRSGAELDRDCRLVNMFYDRITKENERRIKSLKKRPGITDSTVSLGKTTASSPIRGYYYDVDSDSPYWCVENKVYNINLNTATSNLLQVLPSTTGQVGFCSFLKEDGTRLVVFTDGTDMYLHDYTGGTVTHVTDPDLPVPHQPFPIYLDGYLFIIKSNTGDLYNSDLDDPSAWTPGNFITAEISSDYALRPIKAKNYLVLLGYNSIEYFYDNANVSGSPLSRNDSPFRGIGLVTGCCTIGDTTFFVGQDQNQNVSVYSLNSFKVERISNEVVDRTIQTYLGQFNERSPLELNRDGYSLSVDGHNFYVLVTDQTTWVYDIDEKFWYEWQGVDGNGLQIEAVWQRARGNSYLALENQANFCVMNPHYGGDFNVPFSMIYTTEKIDVETSRWKFFSRIMVLCDQDHDNDTSNMQIYYTFDDWVNETGPRDVNVFSENTYAMRLGRGREVAFRLEYTDNYPLRITGIELEVNVGTH